MRHFMLRAMELVAKQEASIDRNISEILMLTIYSKTGAENVSKSEILKILENLDQLINY